MIPGLAKYFDHAESFLKEQVIRPPGGGGPAFGATRHSPDNPISGMAPLLNLQTAGVRKWLITRVFSRGGENIVDKCGFLPPISPKIQSQRESYDNILILQIFLLTKNRHPLENRAILSDYQAYSWTFPHLFHRFCGKVSSRTDMLVSLFLPQDLS